MLSKKHQITDHHFEATVIRVTDSKTTIFLHIKSRKHKFLTHTKQKKNPFFVLSCTRSIEFGWCCCSGSINCYHIIATHKQHSNCEQALKHQSIIVSYVKIQSRQMPKNPEIGNVRKRTNETKKVKRVI